MTRLLYDGRATFTPLPRKLKLHIIGVKKVRKKNFIGRQVNQLH